tara:strand:- start:2 stop:4468 length:4467 start_codon:yes stop_codon:yes gene_type:complete
MADKNLIEKTVDFYNQRQEAGKEYRQQAKEAGDRIKQTTASKVVRGAISGPLKAINETVETVDDVADYFRGNPYDNNDLIDLQSIGLEVEGDKEDWKYTIPQAVTQFLLPMGLVGGGLRKVITNPWARGAVAGFVTDAVVQDPYEENLFNMLDKHPRFASPVTEILKAKTEEEIGVAEARLRQATGGTLTGEVATGVVLGVRALKKAPKAVQERILKRLFNDENTRLVYAASDDIDNLGDEIIPDKPVSETQPIKLDLTIDTRGKGEFYHGTAKEIPDGKVTSVESGENITDGNLLGNGFYTTDDLTTAGKYQKKGKKQVLKPDIPLAPGITRRFDMPYGLDSDLSKSTNATSEEYSQLLNPGIEVPSPDRLRDLAKQARQFPIDNPYSSGRRTNVDNFNKLADRLDELAVNPPKAKEFKPVVYKLTEKQPVKFFDADNQISWTDTSPETKTIREALEDRDYGETLDFWERSKTASYADLISELKDEVARLDRPIYEATEIIDDLNSELQKLGYGGLTHQGGVRAGKGKRLHKVNIYWDAENQLNINKVDVGGGGAAVPPRKPPSGSSGADVPPVDPTDPKVQTTFNPKFTGGGDPDVQKLILDGAEEIKNLDASGQWPYRRTFKDMVNSANQLLPKEVIEQARLFNARYGRGGESDLPATLIAMNQQMNRNAIALDNVAKAIENTVVTGNKEGFAELKEQLIRETKTLDGLITLNKPLKTIPAQTLAANKAAGGLADTVATADDLVGKQAVQGAMEDASKEISEVTVKAQKTLQEILDAAEKGDVASIRKIRKITKRIQAAGGDPEKLRKMIRPDYMKKGFEINNELFINAILSGPETHAVNILSTALNTVVRPMDQILGSAVTADMTGMIRGGKELYYLTTAVSDSWKMARAAFRTENNILNAGAMIDDREAAKRFAIRMDGEGTVASLVNGHGRFVRYSGRFLLAEDEFFKQLNFRSYVKASAWENGVRNGLEGAKLKQYIKDQFDSTIEIVNKNSMKDVKDEALLDLYNKAQQYAAETTFTADLPKGSFGGDVQSFINKHPSARTFFPFIRTPINIFKAQMRRTLLVAPFMDEYRQALKSSDPSIAAKARGELIVGSTIWTVGISTATAINDPLSEVGITGGGPSDYKFLNQMKETGWQPYSFRFLEKDKNGQPIIGQDGKPKYKYVSYKRFDPWASFLMMSADMAAIMGQLNKEDREDLATVAGVAMARNITNKTYLQGVSELAQILSEDWKQIGNWLPKRIAATVPYSALGRSVKKAIDPTIMDKRIRPGDEGMIALRKLYNELAVTIPGYGDLKPIQNFITGSLVEYPPGYGPDIMNIMNPIKETNSVNNLVLTTLVDIGAKITPPKDELFGGVKLDRDQYSDLVNEIAFTKIGGVRMVHALNKTMKRTDVQALLATARGENIDTTNQDTSVAAQEKARAAAEDIFRQIINAYKKQGREQWIRKPENRELALKYDEELNAINEARNNSVLENFKQLQGVSN